MGMATNQMEFIMRILHRVALTCGCLLTLLLCHVSVQAQQERSPARGFQAANSYALSNIETINVTNGNLILRVPLASLPAGRGTSPGFTVNAIYNSKLWNAKGGTANGSPDETGNIQYNYDLVEPSEEGGWSLGLYYKLTMTNRLNLEREYPCDGTDYVNKNAYIWKLKMTFPDGSVHEFRPLGFQDHLLDGYFNIDANGIVRQVSMGTVGGGSNSCSYSSYLGVSTGMVYFSTDGTFMRLEVDHVNNSGDGSANPWTLYFPDGSKVTSNASAQRTYDRNGNYVEVAGGSYNGYSGTKISDQLGRAIIVGLSEVHAWGVNGEHLQTNLHWRDLFINKRYQSSSAQNAPAWERNRELTMDFYVVDQITLPSQSGSQIYTFDYNGDAEQPAYDDLTNGWGELKSVTLPSGARADYSYMMDGEMTYAPWAFDVLNNSPTRKDVTYNLEYDGTSTPTTETWLYDISAGWGGTVTAPDGSYVIEQSSGGFAYRTRQSNGNVVERLWANNGYGNQYVKTEWTTVANVAGQPSLTAIKDFSYDRNGNVTQVVEYDWVAYSSIPRDANGYITGPGIPSGATVRRVTVNTYYNPTPDASNTASTDANIYMYRSPKTFKRALKSSEVRTGAGVVVTRTEFAYDNPDTTGNLIEQKSWDSSKGGYTNPLTGTNSISTTTQYNQYGAPTLTTDRRGIQTQIIYGAVGAFIDLYQTEVRTAINTNVQRTANMEYDFQTGLATRSTDLDNNVSTATSYDVFGRPILVKEAEGKAQERRTSTEYSDTLRRVIVRSDLTTAGDGKLVSIQHFDQMGRVRLTRQLENAATQSATDETTGIKVETRYGYGNDATGQYSYQMTSNPFRAASPGAATAEATMGWTISKQYASGRLQTVQTFSGAGAPAPVGTNANSTGVVTSTSDVNTAIVVDQAGKQRKSVTDALGRLTAVCEAPNDTTSFNFQTSYSYDVLNNLRTVTQSQQTRTFNYDSLGRLSSATNPESGTISYGYDNDGNLLTKTDARGPTSSYSYDALNRVTQRSYSGGTANPTPTVNYFYDAGTVTNSKGRLTSISSSVSGYNYSGYDALGRITASQQVTDGQTYSMSYQYDLAGNMTSQTYPTGRVVSQSFDKAGRLANISGQSSGGTPKTYANSFGYSAHGAVERMRLGNGRWEHTTFNDRLQPTEISLGTSANDSSVLKLNYEYGTTANNGNVLKQIITVPTIGTATGFTVTQHYQYDQLSRLTGAQEVNGTSSAWQSSGALWQQMFSFDRYGNRAVDTANTTSTMIGPNPQISTSTNRIVPRSSPVEYYQYDAAGNMNRGQTGETLDYDAENKLVQYQGGATQSGGANYSYDGDGRRLKKATPAETLIFVYNISGQLVAEYTTSTTQNNGTSYLTSDTLGSPRAITKADGSVRARHDYLPFGEELYASTGNRTTGQKYDDSASPTDKTRQKFTGYDRDYETALDYAINRYYASTQGRFTSVDPLMASAKQADPQTWNRYVYVLNRPTVAIDPDGLSIIVVVISPRSSGGNGSAIVQVFERHGNNVNIRQVPERPTNRADGIAIGQRPDRATENGDTPFGVYRPFGDARANANGVQGGVAGQAARQGEPEYGTGIIYLAPVSGEVVDSNRSTIYVHGGGRPLNEALEAHQPLTPTNGCVRVENNDVNDLVRTVNNLSDSGDGLTNVFMGDHDALNAMADERGPNGNYLYPELRNAFGMPNQPPPPPPPNDRMIRVP